MVVDFGVIVSVGPVCCITLLMFLPQFENQRPSKSFSSLGTKMTSEEDDLLLGAEGIMLCYVQFGFCVCGTAY